MSGTRFSTVEYTDHIVHVGTADDRDSWELGWRERLSRRTYRAYRAYRSYHS